MHDLIESNRPALRVLAHRYGFSSMRFFRQSRLIQDAVIRNLQTLAESSQRLSEPTKAISQDVPWRAISGFRNILVHDYLGVNLDMVWLVVSTDLPALQTALSKIRLSD